ncbi:hypothetical protein [Aquabacterium sp.]|uniref:hypothetical protein n=1 Tax=Aquabacterium sp. TaxID=1872578 RepID=UPI002BF09932|nr:hypothetical protein [Aquabacterium sp.]HSW03445.1 hypothetical protein [Aquabacterium sp.]
MDIIELLRVQAERANALELRERRDYHAYLKARGDDSETLEEHVARYASLAWLGQPAVEHDLVRLQAICPVPLPAALLSFYRTAAGFRGGGRLQDAVIHAPADLLRASELPAGQWDALRSMGLVHMVLRAWGNDRFEFDPDSQEGLDRPSVDALNTNYAIIGWRVMDDGEAHEFLYFDRQGRFGRLFYHQDAFDELLADHLLPMVRQSRPAPGDFGTVLSEFIAAAGQPSSPG